MRIQIFGTAAASGILTVCLANMPILRAADPPRGEPVAKLLLESKNEAIQLKDDAAIMESYTWSDVIIESRCIVIERIRERVYAIGRQLAQLEVERATAGRWQKRAIDWIAPLLDELASHTQGVIDDLERPSGRLKFRDHRELSAANAREAADLAALISGYVDLAGRRNGERNYIGTAELPGVK